MQEPTREPLLVWGAGAMGGTIGACLAHAGRPVHFVDRDREHVAAMRLDGLRVEGPIFQTTVPVEAFDPTGLTGEYGCILLCVKAHHTEDAVAQLIPYLAEDGFVVSIQNGLNEAVIAEGVGVHRTVGAFVNFGADLIGPGVVHWGGRGAVVLGELDGRSTPRLRSMVAELQRFEPAASATDNIFGFLWGKLAYAALLFATALTDDSIADALASSEHRALFVRIAEEVVAVAEAEGIALEGFDGFDPAAFASRAGADHARRSLDDLVRFNRRSAKTHSGIWRDLAVRKRKTEVDAQLGPVVATGRRHGLPVRLVDGIIGQIHEIEEGVRARSRSNLDVLASSIGLGRSP